MQPRLEASLIARRAYYSPAPSWRPRTVSAVALRNLTRADAEAVVAFALIHAFPREPDPPEDARARPEVRRWIDHWDEELGVGWGEAGTLLGAAWARHLEPTLALDTLTAAPIPELILAVLPSARGQGIGHQLLEAMKARAIAAREHGLALMVGERFPIALHMYERAGFIHQLRGETGLVTMVWYAREGEAAAT